MSMTSTPNLDATVKPDAGKKTLVLVSHTHWDREWYLTFQQYRVKLVRLIDRLLNLLDTNDEYAHFMLDGQTIVLEDYLEIRPERRADLERHIRAGRLLVGPWYILADQFLVSGEAHIQNLLRGRQIAQEFGSSMSVGYIPDPFGHTGQMPQILRGFGIDSAVFWRGVGLDIWQTEFVWAAPDGSEVNGVHLRGSANIGGYSSALSWNSGPEAALAQFPDIKTLILNHVKSGVALLMNGNDHVEPSADIPQTIRAVKAGLEKKGQSYEIIHGTLPMYLEMARQSGIWEHSDTPRHVGEFRDSRLAHLLPGVWSARMPIKQWNARIERLLERESGAALAWAASLPGGSNDSFDPASLRALYRTAWKYLLQNHPHDSICGCSIDQVHAEMDTRFAWAEQLGEELLKESWRTLAQAINTAVPALENQGVLPVVIFNPVPLRRTEVASLAISATEGLSDMVLANEKGEILPHRISDVELELFFNMDIPAASMAGMAAQGGDEGRIMDYTMASVDFIPDVDPKIVEARVLAVYQSAAPTASGMMKKAMDEVTKCIARGVETIRLAVYKQTNARLEFLANEVPANGHKTFYLRPRQATDGVLRVEKKTGAEMIENEFYELTVDAKTGLFSVRDKETEIVYSGLHQFRDGSDAGDEYNYSPATEDLLIENYFTAPEITVVRSALESTLTLDAALELPFSLTNDRKSRGAYNTVCPIQVKARLVAGQRRIDFTTIFLNGAEDHRLQVLFPAPFTVTTCQAEQAFDVVERSTELPKFDQNWREDPVPTAPQKTFVSIHDPAQDIGLTVMNQGLPEYEITQLDGKSAVALTLLRCVGWLSRSDLSSRRDHAGPGLATPAAQLRGEQVFHYAIMPHKGNWLQAGAQQQAQAFNHPLTGLTAAMQSGQPLPAESSFVQILPRAIALSTIKPSEDGRGLIVRLWNPAERDIPEAKVHFYRHPARAALVNLAEDTILQELTIAEDGGISFPLGHKQIATIRLEF